MAGDHLAAARRAAQATGDRGEELVAGGVAEAVVDELEVVEVDEEDGERRYARRLAADGRLEALLEADSVGEAGQRVVVGDVPELALGVGERLGRLLSLGDVDDDAVDEHAPVLGLAWVHAVPHPARSPVVADEAVLDLAGLAAVDRLVRGVVRRCGRRRGPRPPTPARGSARRGRGRAGSRAPRR